MNDFSVALDLTLDRERFPVAKRYVEFHQLFVDHGIEARGRELELDVVRYAQMERDGRLGWFVARQEGAPIGYSLHYVYVGLHGPERLGHDDIWYVRPDCRHRGIGRALKELGHGWLREKGCVSTEDIVRGTLHRDLLQSMGYTHWGSRWMKHF